MENRQQDDKDNNDEASSRLSAEESGSSGSVDNGSNKEPTEEVGGESNVPTISKGDRRLSNHRQTSSNDNADRGFMRMMCGLLTKPSCLLMMLWITILGLISAIVVVVVVFFVPAPSVDVEQTVTEPPTTSPFSPFIPTKSPSVGILEHITDIILSQNITEMAAISNPSSPQYHSLNWLSFDDELTPKLTAEYLRTFGTEQSLSFQRQILERYAIVVLYFATTGPNWFLLSGWLNDYDICGTRTWIGVECASMSGSNGNNDDSQGVTGLELMGNGLEGSIPVEIGLLSQLTRLNLSNNNLNGEIPSEIGLLSQLKTLQLYDGNLVGPIPSEIGILSQLDLLQLHNNHLDGSLPTELGFLSQLKTLILNFNNLSGSIPTEVGLLSQLRVLDLEGNLLHGPIPTQLGMLENTIVLFLNNNTLSGLIPWELGQLGNLIDIRLENNLLAGIINTIYCDPINTTEIDNSRFPQLDQVTSDCFGGNGTAFPTVVCSCCIDCQMQ